MLTPTFNCVSKKIPGRQKVTDVHPPDRFRSDSNRTTNLRTDVSSVAGLLSSLVVVGHLCKKKWPSEDFPEGSTTLQDDHEQAACNIRTFNDGIDSIQIVDEDTL